MSFVDIPAPHGLLEALFWPVESPKAATVVCHPHPLGGGTMHNNVTYRLAQAFRDAKVSALRFNFRGVGRSTGRYDEGRGEVDDARSALDWLERQHPGVPLYAAGFSFGSYVALRLAERDRRVAKVMAVGVPVSMFDFGFVAALDKPKAFVQAEYDEYGPLEEVRRLVERCSEPKRLFVVPGATHLAHGRLDAFSAVAAQAVEWLLSA